MSIIKRFIKLVVFFLIVFVIIFYCFNDKGNVGNSSIIDISKNLDNKSESSISIVCVGDNLIHSSIYEDAYKGNDEYDFKPMYSLIKPIVSKYDLAYYNQETILGGDEIGLSSYPSFNSPYEVGDAMIDAGFNVVSLATNHTLDRGEKAVINSRKYWNSKNNVLAVGSYSSFDERNSVVIKEVNGIKYSILNYTYGTNGISIPSGKDYLVNVWPVKGTDPNYDSAYQDYKDKVKEDIEKVRDKVDVLIVAMHWGIEYELSPNEYQFDAAKYLSSLGVNVVIGTHPHVIQPIDYIDDTLVIYSLGNFFSAHEVINMDNRVGLMTSFDIIKDSDGKVKVDNLSNDLLYTYYENYKNFSVIPFSNSNITKLSNYKDVYKKYVNIVRKYNDNIEFVPYYE